jgi:hypothetical protein
LADEVRGVRAGLIEPDNEKGKVFVPFSDNDQVTAEELSLPDRTSLLIVELLPIDAANHGKGLLDLLRSLEESLLTVCWFILGSIGVQVKDALWPASFFLPYFLFRALRISQAMRAQPINS